MEKHLHIICFDVPYPVDNGVMMDIFYTLQTLHAAGIQVHLHCFDGGRGEQSDLDKYCAEVNYYPLQSGHKGFSYKLPYGVASRSNPELLTRLIQDDFPILLEGIQCSYLLYDEQFSNRKIFLRTHQVAHRYFRELSQASSSPFKKLYYLHESKLMLKHENYIAGKVTILTQCQQDAAVYRQELKAKAVISLPAFLPFQDTASKGGIGCFCLYHGNLSAIHNEKAALWLLRNVANKLNVHFVFAGKDPSPRLEQAIRSQSNTCLVANPSEQEMQDLISQAHIHVLPSLSNKPFHVKLLNALFNGRHCIVNEQMVIDSALAPSCHVATTAEAFQSVIVQLKHQPFDDHEILLRRNLLHKYFDNEQNAKRLLSLIYGELSIVNGQ